MKAAIINDEVYQVYQEPTFWQRWPLSGSIYIGPCFITHHAGVNWPRAKWYWNLRRWLWTQCNKGILRWHQSITRQTQGASRSMPQGGLRWIPSLVAWITCTLEWGLLTLLKPRQLDLPLPLPPIQIYNSLIALRNPSYKQACKMHCKKRWITPTAQRSSISFCQGPSFQVHIIQTGKKRANRSLFTQAQ